VKISGLRKYLREKLPEYIIPAAFVVLDAFPLNSSGKVDRNVLPAPSNERADSGVIYVSPKTDLEQTIASIWQGVLSIERIGLDDNFFDLGGHSLLMAKVHTQLQEALKKEFSLINLFRYPTVSALAEFLTGDKTDDMSNIEEAAERATLQKEAIKRQSDRMRSIAKSRTGSSEV
jgi:acyl carrier protein